MTTKRELANQDLAQGIAAEARQCPGGMWCRCPKPTPCTVRASVDELIAAKEAELESARAAVTASWGQPAGASKMRGKQHRARVDAQLRRDAQNADAIRRLERELAALRNQQTAPAPVDLSRLPYARFVRTKYGWFEVVRVNRATVKVLAAPGMDDRIPIRKIVEIREGEAA